MGLLEDGVESLQVSWICFSCSEIPAGKVCTSSGRSTRLKSAKGGFTNRPMMLVQRRKKSGSAQNVRFEAVQTFCDRGKDKYKGLIGTAQGDFGMIERS